MGFCNGSMFCCALLYVHSSFAIIFMGKRELVALLSLSSWCLVIVVWLFLAVPWVCLQFVIVVFPDHTHYFCFLLNVPRSHCCCSFHFGSLSDLLITKRFKVLWQVSSIRLKELSVPLVK